MYVVDHPLDIRKWRGKMVFDRRRRHPHYWSQSNVFHMCSCVMWLLRHFSWLPLAVSGRGRANKIIEADCRRFSLMDNKLAKLRRHASQVHFAKIHFRYILSGTSIHTHVWACKPSWTFLLCFIVFIIFHRFQLFFVSHFFVVFCCFLKCSWFFFALLHVFFRFFMVFLFVSMYCGPCWSGGPMGVVDFVDCWLIKVQL